MKRPPIAFLNQIARMLHDLQQRGLSHAEAERQIFALLFGAEITRRDQEGSEGILSRPDQDGELEPGGNR